MISKKIKGLRSWAVLIGFLGLIAAPAGWAADLQSCSNACSQENAGSPASLEACLNGCYALYSQTDGESSLPITGTGGESSLPITGQSEASLPNFLGSGVNSISDLLLKIVDFLMNLVIPFAVLMLVWAGFQFATAQGNPDKIEKAKKNLVWTVVGIAVILASRAIIGYITQVLTGGSGADNALVLKVKSFLNEIISLLFILVTVYFFWGIVELVRASGSGDTKALDEGKKHMIWGIVGMAVMSGAWVIVNMLQSFFR